MPGHRNDWRMQMWINGGFANQFVYHISQKYSWFYLQYISSIHYLTLYRLGVNLINVAVKLSQSRYKFRMVVINQNDDKEKMSQHKFTLFLCDLLARMSGLWGNLLPPFESLGINLNSFIAFDCWWSKSIHCILLFDITSMHSICIHQVNIINLENCISSHNSLINNTLVKHIPN